MAYNFEDLGFLVRNSLARAEELAAEGSHEEAAALLIGAAQVCQEAAEWQVNRQSLLDEYRRA